MTDAVEVVTLTREQYDQLISGLRTLARIPCPGGVEDDWPLMEASGRFIRAGHVREARAVLRTLAAER